MRTLFDTSVLVAMREGNASIVSRSAQISSPALMSAVSVVELEGGVITAVEGAEVRRIKLDKMFDSLDVLPFDRAQAEAYRTIIQAVGFSRSRIIDRMIAAQALVAGAALATLNARDFRDVPGLQVEDWSA